MAKHFNNDAGIRLSDENPGYTLGRGRLFIDGRYIGNTPYCRIAFRPESYSVLFGADVISEENKALFLGGSRVVALVYESRNPAGNRTSFTAGGLLLPSGADLKGDEWVTLDFCLLCDRIGWTAEADETKVPDVGKPETRVEDHR